MRISVRGQICQGLRERLARLMNHAKSWRRPPLVPARGALPKRVSRRALSCRGSVGRVICGAIHDATSGVLTAGNDSPLFLDKPGSGFLHHGELRVLLGTLSSAQMAKAKRT